MRKMATSATAGRFVRRRLLCQEEAYLEGLEGFTAKSQTCMFIFPGVY